MAKQKALATRNEEETQLAIPDAPTAVQAYKGEGTEDLASGGIDLPLVSIVQAESGRGRKEDFGEGSAILVPDDLLICDVEGDFSASVIHAHKSWGLWRDINDKSSPFPMVEQSYDENGELARLSKTFGSKKSYGDNFNGSVFEHLDFVLMLDGGGDIAPGTIALLRYKSTGYKVGRKLRQLLSRCGQRGWPIYAPTLKFVIKPITNSLNKDNYHPVATLQTVSQDGLEDKRKKFQDIDRAWKDRKITMKEHSEVDEITDGMGPDDE